MRIERFRVMGTEPFRKRWKLIAAATAIMIAAGAGSAIAASSSGSIPFNQPMVGTMTFYNNIGTDACGTQIDPTTQLLVAVSPVWFTAPNPNNDPLCSEAYVEVTANGLTLKLPVLDKCASCDATHIDVSQAAFQQFAPLSVGVLNGVTWQFLSDGKGDGTNSPLPCNDPAAVSAQPVSGQSSGQPPSGQPPSGQPPSGQPAPSQPPAPSQSPVPPNGCAAPFVPGTSFAPGTVVSFNGDNFTATSFTNGATPSDQSSVWSDDGPC